MPEIWRKNKLYTFLRPYVDACTRNSYCRVSQKGVLPRDGAVIIAPNHTNTLMDALVILQSRRDRTVYASRADIFRKPFIAGILRFLKMVPLARSRDNRDEIAHNREVLQEVDDTLAHGVPFCIFAEGTHRPKHSLLPIRKGIARIALDSASQRQTYIVPAGIEYSDWFHYRSRVSLTYGEPINVNSLMEENKGLTDRELYSIIQNELHKRLSGLIVYFPDDENYDAAVKEWEDAHRRPAWLRILRFVLVAVLSPLFLLSAVMTLPMWAGAEYLCSRKIKDHAFWNTARYGFKLVGTPLMLIIWGVVLALLIGVLPWWLCLALWCWFFHAYSFFYDWLNLLR